MTPSFGLPEPVSFHRVFEWAVARHASREALVTGEGRLRFDELGERVRRLATAMKAAGIGRGDHVGLLLPNSLDWAALFYAAASIGAVTVPLNTRFKRDELQFCLSQAKVSTLFFVARLLKTNYLDLLTDIEPCIRSGLPGRALPVLERAVIIGGAAATEVTSFNAFIAAASQAASTPEAPLNGDATMLIQYTSGTTAFPKGVMLTHRGMLLNAAAAAARMGVLPGDRYFSVRPFSHVGGSTLTLLASLVSGATVVTQATYDVADALRLMSDERCTLVSGNDTIFQMLMAHEAFDPARLCLRGGWAAAGPETMRRIHVELGAGSMVNAYGLSEASPNVAMNDWQDAPSLRREGWAHPHAGTEVRIVDPETMARCAPHTAGEIHVRGWSVMKGYFDMPEATAAAITADGWLRTGDLGEMDGDGRIRMIGRLKDIVRVGGENVSPAEVEETLLRHPAVAMAQVVGVPDARLIEVPAAYVQTKAGATVDEAGIRAWCTERCAGFKVPRYVRIVPSFDWAPVTSSGKIQKAALRAQAIRDFGLDAPSSIGRVSR